MVDIFVAVIDLVAVRIRVQRVGVRTGIIHTVAARFRIIGNAVVIRVGVRVKIIDVVDIVHAVVIIVGVVAVGNAVSVKITSGKQQTRVALV